MNLSIKMHFYIIKIRRKGIIYVCMATTLSRFKNACSVIKFIFNMSQYFELNYVVYGIEEMM